MRPFLVLIEETEIEKFSKLNNVFHFVELQDLYDPYFHPASSIEYYQQCYLLILVTAIGGRPKPELFFLPGRLR